MATTRKQAAASGRRNAVEDISGTTRARSPVDATLKSLTTKSGIDVIRTAWQRRLRSTPPAIQSADLLLRLFAWRVQIEAYGGLDEATALRLNQISRAQIEGTASTIPAVAELEAGTVLIRKWRNVEHRVLVLDDAFEHQSQRYKTLSEVARAITGTRWSGPRFFGIERDERAVATKSSAAHQAGSS